jgi:hypothetical protein
MEDEVKTREPRAGIVELTLKVESGLIAAPQGCPATGGSTALTTAVMLDDHVNAPQRLEWTLPWRCGRSQLATP